MRFKVTTWGKEAPDGLTEVVLWDSIGLSKGHFNYGFVEFDTLEEYMAWALKQCRIDVSLPKEGETYDALLEIQDDFD